MTEIQEAYDLLPAEIVKNIPPLYGTENEHDAVAHLKWLISDSVWTWFVVEFDPTERLCLGLVIGHERELGYFFVDEIESVTGPMGLRVERDLAWKPAPLPASPSV